MLILDEATNALDIEAESIVLDRLNQMSADISMLVIAHRLSTVRNADLVVVIDAGRVVDRVTGHPYRWEPAVTVLPVSDRLRAVVSSRAYRDAADRARQALSFTVTDRSGTST